LRKTEGRRPLGKTRRRRVYNNEAGFKEIGREGKEWINLAQDRDKWRALVNTLKNLWVS
jgi:hypothetical protein